VIVLAAPAAAQQPSATDLSIAAFLEKRVPEELASEGVVLSRHNLTLKVEMLGDKLLLSLVDLSTGRAVASTKVDQIPPDRDAAVASVTHVAADLAGQIVRRGASPPAAATPPPVDERAERQAREVAELRFHKQAIRFGEAWDLSYTKNGGLSARRRWLAYQGESDQVLEATDFYKEVGRPDLADDYNHRKHIAYGGMIVGGLGVIAGGVMLYKFALAPLDPCSIDLPAEQYGACVTGALDKHERERSQYVKPMLIVSGVSIAAMLVGLWYAVNVHPISENEAKGLADKHNQNLRKNLGLPVARRLHDIKLVPYASAGDSGLALAGRF
jgi:hypothetical protein